MPRPRKTFKLDGYEVKNHNGSYLGEGTYGTVFLATEMATGRDVAIKLHHNLTREKGIPSNVLRETTLLNLLKNSPYVVKMQKTVYIKSHKQGKQPTTYMIFEHLNCDLHQYAVDNRPLSTDIVRRIMYHILVGLHHCHGIGLMHRDLKPHNVLMDTTNPNRPVAKLADFGFGRAFTMPIRQLTEEIVTLWYRPPEVLLGHPGHSPAVDIWGAACILCELYENKILFCGDCGYDQLMRIFRLLGTPKDEPWAKDSCQFWNEFPKFPRQDFKDYMTGTPMDAIDLLEQMLMGDPAKRPSAEQCLRHDYFTSIFTECDLTMMPLQPSDLASSSPLIHRLKPLPDHQPNNPEPVFNSVFCRQPGTD